MPQAFNQYVPAGAVGGYSLDVMRRTADPDAPNGLTDFVIIETIDWMRQRGHAGARAQLRHDAGRAGRRGGQRALAQAGAADAAPLQRHRAIESLWKFNEKYDPTWRPRYVVTDSMLNRPRAGLAIARAESVVELPVVGRSSAGRRPNHDA